MTREESRYADHPQVTNWTTDPDWQGGGLHCEVFGANTGIFPLWVRRGTDGWLADDLDGEDSHLFDTMDEGIEWALGQAGGLR